MIPEETVRIPCSIVVVPVFDLRQGVDPLTGEGIDLQLAHIGVMPTAVAGVAAVDVVHLEVADLGRIDLELEELALVVAALIHQGEPVLSVEGPRDREALLPDGAQMVGVIAGVVNNPVKELRLTQIQGQLVAAAPGSPKPTDLLGPIETVNRLRSKVGDSGSGRRQRGGGFRNKPRCQVSAVDLLYVMLVDALEPAGVIVDIPVLPLGKGGRCQLIRSPSRVFDRLGHPPGIIIRIAEGAHRLADFNITQVLIRLQLRDISVMPTAVAGVAAVDVVHLEVADLGRIDLELKELALVVAALIHQGEPVFSIKGA